MTTQGIIVVALAAIVLALWVMNLVRRGRLWVGYGVMFVVAAAASMVTVSVPAVLAVVTALVGAVFPVSALTLIAVIGMAFLFVYVLSQLTILANRVATLVQELGMERARQHLEGRRPKP